MFGCVISRYVWAIIRDSLVWDRAPASLEGFLSGWLGRGSGKHAKMHLFSLRTVCWALWKVRTK
jgi:hypothetical protein